jgi:hypothetical protein
VRVGMLLADQSLSPLHEPCSDLYALSTLDLRRIGTVLWIGPNLALLTPTPRDNAVQGPMDLNAARERPSRAVEVCQLMGSTRSNNQVGEIRPARGFEMDAFEPQMQELLRLHHARASIMSGHAGRPQGSQLGFHPLRIRRAARIA